MKKGLPYNLQFFAAEEAADVGAADSAQGDVAQEDASRNEGENESGSAEGKDAGPVTEQKAQHPEKDMDITQLVAEELKKAAMPEDERRKYEADLKEKELQSREQALAVKELRADAKAILAENGLPESFLDMVVGKDLKDTQDRVKAMKAGFDTAVQEQVSRRLRGTTPRTGTGATGDGRASALAAQVESYL